MRDIIELWSPSFSYMMGVIPFNDTSSTYRNWALHLVLRIFGSARRLTVRPGNASLPFADDYWVLHVEMCIFIFASEVVWWSRLVNTIRYLQQEESIRVQRVVRTKPRSPVVLWWYSYNDHAVLEGCTMFLENCAWSSCFCENWEAS